MDATLMDQKNPLNELSSYFVQIYIAAMMNGKVLPVKEVKIMAARSPISVQH